MIRPDMAHQRADRARIGSALRLVGLCWLAVLCLGSPASAAGHDTPEKALAAFQTSWAARSASGVSALVDPRGTVRVSLLAPRQGGTWTPAQARRALDTYFGARGVSGTQLKDVTPARSRQKTVRLYDYTYRPHGGDVRTTRLTVVVKQDQDRKWVLASVTESQRPAPRR
jgi:hypothetical protein